MGLTSRSTGLSLLKDDTSCPGRSPDELIVALAGNPNVGKSTVFNSLTGLNQHTGNWPGKTVANARGRYHYKDKDFTLVDIPGTYSLSASSVEEEVARDFICFAKPDAVVVVTDATCLERNLNLVIQVLEVTKNVVVCVNLFDEARRKKIDIDLAKLEQLFGVPVVGSSAREGYGLTELMEAVYGIANKTVTTRPFLVTYDEIIEQAIKLVEPHIRALNSGNPDSRWLALKLLDGDPAFQELLQEYLESNLLQNEILMCKVKNAREFLRQSEVDNQELKDRVVSAIINLSEEICRKTVKIKNIKYNCLDEKIDSIVTSRIYGIPIMIGLLGFVFWLTIAGANYPSKLLAGLLFWVEEQLTDFFIWTESPVWLHGLLVKGIYRTLAWVVSVMLPPMAIFFPLFTLLEDLGYLPRIAFNLDNFFKKACAHGKQALTMCMGLGCNAAGVVGCRIIDSPRERLIATVTNNFIPCNGRFPTLIAIASIFIGGTVTGSLKNIVSALTLTAILILGVIMTLLVSKVLSMTLLKGLPSSFTLELPPYRKPQVGKIIVRSVFDRTLFVLGRAISVAAPAGLVIWLMANLHIGGMSLLDLGARTLQPFAYAIGLDGHILMAFILGFPANEIVVPIIIMSYLAGGSLVELDSYSALRELLVSHGWNWLTGVCMMLFSLMHFPCGTTLWTIKKETQSWKWTLISFLLPTAAGIVVCFIVAQTVRALGII